MSSSKTHPEIILLVDRREQRPYTFSRWPEVTVQRATLKTGDYTIKGYEDVVAVERKELNDLIACLMGHNRSRFENELQRSALMDHFIVVVEASLEDIARHRYTSLMKPHAAIASILALQLRWRIPFVFAGSRDGAQYITYHTLRLFLREQQLRGV